MSNPDKKPNYNWIWNLQCPNKIKFFIWQCMHNKIPCRAYLHNIGINIYPSGPMCKEGLEDASHIFIKCSIAARFWSSIGLIVSQSDVPTHWLTFNNPKEL